MSTEIDGLLAKARLELNFDSGGVETRAVRAVFNALVVLHERIKRIEQKERDKPQIAA